MACVRGPAAGGGRPPGVTLAQAVVDLQADLGSPIGVRARLLATSEGPRRGGEPQEGLDLLLDVAGAIGDGERVAGGVVAGEVDVGGGGERRDGDEETEALVDEPLGLDGGERALEGAQR